MKRSALKPRSRRRTMTPAERALSRYWHDQVTAGPCVMCIHFPPSRKVRDTRLHDLRRREGHHILAKRILREEGHGDPVTLWMPDNGMCLCAYHHARHESWMQRVPRRLIPRRAWAFAIELGLAERLEREYPENEGERS